MTLTEYFENTQGRCVLATADAKGMVDLAIYSRPHVIDEETVAFTKIREEEDQEVIEKFRRKKSYELPDDDKKKRFLVYFHIDKVLPLIGDHE